MDQAMIVAAKEAGAAQVKFYYDRTPIIDNAFTACLLLDKSNNILARGISICSILDKHNKKEARNKACGRAIKALVNKENTLPINPTREEWDHTCIEQTFKGDPAEFAREYEKYCLQVSAGQNCGDGSVEYRYLVPYSHPILHTSMFFEWKSEFQPEPTEEEMEIFPNLFNG